MDFEYVFGINGNAEMLQVKGPSHTALTGFQQVVREYPGETVTDSFRVVRRLKSEEDQAGSWCTCFQPGISNKNLLSAPIL